MSEGKDSAASEDRILGSEALKAFAHPLRMSLYAELQRRGPATASQLARALGESSGQTSYHLRQLERHGFVEDDPGHAGGRERWWRPVGFRLTDPELLHDPATEPMVGAVIGQVIAERTATLTAWFEHLDAELGDGTGQLSTSTMELTTEEADALTTELLELIERYSGSAKNRERPSEARRYRVYLDVIPLTVDLREDNTPR